MLGGPSCGGDSRLVTRAETRLDQVAAGRGVPCDHLAGHPGAGPVEEHAGVVDGIKGDAAGGRDGAIDRGQAFDRNRHGLGEVGDRRRLGILLDPLVDGSKESRIAAQIDDRNVMITGHPYVDIWQAVKPSVIGIDHWPEVPKGQPWKEGVIDALGITATPASFWKHVLGKVTSWKDLETPLLGAVEELIDFVAPPEP